ncbi:MAG: cation diffusion facilitator family transporter [Nocardioides marinisabuli]|uniref:cation diffusion facilitator family transporter n=1 Tax=Nocardioides marinisabuli TaxID=419476 RepID=UPI00321904F1
MGAGHGHGHAGATHRWRLVSSFLMVAAFFGVELVVGILSGSLALISDAGHMAADVVALGAALVATKIASRPDATGRRTYGSYRAEIFASGFTVLIMLGVAVYVIFEAFARRGGDVDVAAGPMLIVGAIGLLINIVSILLLRGGAKDSLNVKGAYYEVVADAAGSVGVIGAGVLVALTGDSWWDTVIALAIGIFVAVRAVILGRQVLAVLGQHVPEGMVIGQVADDLTAIEGVADVHDLHAWTLTSGMNVATAHLVLVDTADAQAVLTSAQKLLREQHRVEHATLQVESSPTEECVERAW